MHFESSSQTMLDSNSNREIDVRPSVWVVKRVDFLFAGDQSTFLENTTKFSNTKKMD
jgi:hypothetical protein